jgi:hypothetical protein
MQQGHSGSSLKRNGGLVEKLTTDRAFSSDVDRQQDLIILSGRLAVLPRIMRAEGSLIVMEFIEGKEGLTRQNAFRAGRSLRLLHEQRTFTHPCLTGVGWLIELANANLIRAGASLRISADWTKHFPNDALIHSEPTQLIETARGEIVFIDIEGVGFGSRYQDLGFIEFTAALQDDPEMLQSFIKGYESEPIALDERLRRRMAGLVALAYAGFADTEKRLAVGLRLLRQTRFFSGAE